MNKRTFKRVSRQLSRAEIGLSTIFERHGIEVAQAAKRWDGLGNETTMSIHTRINYRANASKLADWPTRRGDLNRYWHRMYQWCRSRH